MTELNLSQEVSSLIVTKREGVYLAYLTNFPNMAEAAKFFDDAAGSEKVMMHIDINANPHVPSPVARRPRSAVKKVEFLSLPDSGQELEKVFRVVTRRFSGIHRTAVPGYVTWH